MVGEIPSSVQLQVHPFVSQVLKSQLLIPGRKTIETTLGQMEHQISWEKAQ